ncbi:hypothetical protein BDV96DRAFT_654382 [Lophiotrema nucula]|uniref:Heterokaryon incompatibility domain-containing protein n=1 Tax=Lophiotrema nucula TaxID=690887 RepID=A0A6A5YKT9_9PLEO|nr:hypothetical protein BDV96DRAFT_654382 [Lophiotrema nucula]
MDLVPTPTTALAGIEIPCLNVIPYDFKGLVGFPERVGFRDWETGDATRIATLVQSWLYFGLLAEIFGEDIETEDFVLRAKQPYPHCQITLGNIRAHLAQNPNPSERSRRCGLLLDAVRWLRNVERIPLHEQLASPLAQTTLAVRMLFYAIAPVCGSPLLDLWPHPLVSKRLKDAEWCPSHIRLIEGFQDDILGCYLSRLWRPNPRGFSHTKCPVTNCEASSTTLDDGYKMCHTRLACTCPLVTVKEDQLRQIIAKGGIPLIHIEHLLGGKTRLQIRAANASDNYIALSHVWSDGLGNPNSNGLPECQLHRLAGYLSDLPNPSCPPSKGDFRSVFSLGPMSVDFARLTLVWRSSSRPTLFWMDTLCIPVSRDIGDASTKRLKVRAINMMAAIYGRASQVLVLDSTLQQCRLATMRNIEILARIAFCNWIGRSWTLQEGALSPFVYFQFADGAINLLDAMRHPDVTLSNELLHPAAFRLTSLAGTLRSMYWTSKRRRRYGGNQKNNFSYEGHIYSALYKYCTSNLNSYGRPIPKNLPLADRSKIKAPDAHWLQEFVAVWNALAVRTTTLTEDLPAIFANLLGLSAREVLSGNSDQRLNAIILSCDELPVSLLYNRGARYQPAGNHRSRWIPTTISRQPLEEEPFMRVDVSCNLVLQTIFIPNHRPVCLLASSSIDLADLSIIVITTYGQFHIVVHREKDDKLDTAPWSHTAFLITTTTPGLELAACCLRLSPAGDNDSSFTGIYDCPCTAEWVEADPQMTSSVHHLDVRQLETWKIIILGDLPSAPRLRPRVADSITHTWTNIHEHPRLIARFVTICSPLIPLIVIPTILRICLATQYAWTGLSRAGKASLVTFAIQRIPSPLSVIPITQVLFIIDRRAHTEGLRKTEITYIVFDFLWIFYAFVMTGLLMQQWVQYRFRFLLETLEDGSRNIRRSQTKEGESRLCAS